MPIPASVEHQHCHLRYLRRLCSAAHSADRRNHRGLRPRRLVTFLRPISISSATPRGSCSRRMPQEQRVVTGAREDHPRPDEPDDQSSVSVSVFRRVESVSAEGACRGRAAVSQSRARLERLFAHNHLLSTNLSFSRLKLRPLSTIPCPVTTHPLVHSTPFQTLSAPKTGSSPCSDMHSRADALSIPHPWASSTTTSSPFGRPPRRGDNVHW